MRSSRLLAIMLLLQVRGRITADTLAAEFEVSPRTIYRDIDALSAAGIPVYADRGSSGGYKLLEGYRTKLTGLSPLEAESLLLTGMGHVVEDLGLGPSTSMARQKLLAGISTEAGAAADRVSRRIYVDPERWYRRRQKPTHLLAVASAVFAGQRISVDYTSWSRASKHDLDPLGLILKGDTWYLIARSRAHIRTYKVESISKITVKVEAFTPPSNFDLARHWKREVERFERSLLKGRATLRVSNAALLRLDELGAAISEPLRRAKPDKSGWRQATVPVEGIPQTANLLFGMGAAIEVVSPEALRIALRDEARRVLAIYEGKTRRSIRRTIAS